MVCWHDRYNLGDEQPNDDPDDYMLYVIDSNEFEARLEAFWEERYGDKPWDYKEQQEWVREQRLMIQEEFEKTYVSLPLYLYDHSGLSMSTSSFSCPWDSGQVGFIYAKKDDDEELLRMLLVNEVEVYDQYLQGEVYGFVLLNEDGEEEDACWGFFGDDWRENGMADHVDISEVKEVHHMEPQTQEVMITGEVEYVSGEAA